MFLTLVALGLVASTNCPQSMSEGSFSIETEMSQKEFEELAHFLAKENAEPFESMKIKNLRVHHTGDTVSLDSWAKLGSISFSQTTRLTKEEARLWSGSMLAPVFGSSDWGIMSEKMSVACRTDSAESSCSITLSSRDSVHACAGQQ